MKIHYLTLPEADRTIADIELNNHHYVAVAVPGLTQASFYVEFVCGIKSPERDRFLYRVNTAKETGTLFPAGSVTLIPVRTACYDAFETIEHQRDEFTAEEMTAFIRDAFVAERDWVKSGSIIFDFRDAGDDHARCNSIAEELAVGEFEELAGIANFYTPK